MANAGRPRVLADEQKRRQLFAMIATGTGVESAARQVGCSPWTVYREAQRDEDFAQRLRDAQTAVELTPLQAMRQAARDDWRAAAWWLERCYPDRFAKRKPETVSAGDVGNLLNEVATIFSELCPDPELREQFAERVAEVQEQHLSAAEAKKLGPPRAKTQHERVLEEIDRELGARMDSVRQMFP